MCRGRSELTEFEHALAAVPGAGVGSAVTVGLRTMIVSVGAMQMRANAREGLDADRGLLRRGTAATGTRYDGTQLARVEAASESA